MSVNYPVLSISSHCNYGCSHNKLSVITLLVFNIFTLSGCVKPVDFETFLKDDNIADVILNTKKGKIKVEIDFNRSDLSPILMLDNGDLIPDGGSVTIHKDSDPKSVHITVEDAGKYEEIQWLYNGDKLSDEADFTASTGSETFKNAKAYFITVVGLIGDGKAYGTVFNILVVS